MRQVRTRLFTRWRGLRSLSRKVLRGSVDRVYLRQLYVCGFPGVPFGLPGLHREKEDYLLLHPGRQNRAWAEIFMVSDVGLQECV